MNSPTVLSGLHPAFMSIAIRVLREAQERLNSDPPMGDTVRATIGLRSLEAQAAALAAGLSSVRVGWHQYGLALDFGLFDEKGRYLKDGEDPRYRLVGEIAERAGCIWGGRWRKPDWDHIEWHPGFTLVQYQAFLRGWQAPEVTA